MKIYLNAEMKFLANTSFYNILVGGNLQECFERKTEYIGNDLNIANNGIRNKVIFRKEEKFQ